MRMLVSQEEGLIFAVYWLACWQYSRVSVAFLAWHELVLEHARLSLNELCRTILPSLPCGAEVSVFTLFRVTGFSLAQRLLALLTPRLRFLSA
jgi:hypothetical protein